MTSHPGESSSSRLVMAAQELLEAAGIEISSEQQKQMSRNVSLFKESVESKMESVESKFDTVNKNLASTKTAIDDKAIKITQRITNLEQKMSDLTDMVKKQAKMQNLAFAIENSSLGSFSYYENNAQKSSSNLVKDIILTFRREQGMILPNATIGYYGNFEKGNKDFHASLTTQIFSLTGTEPRITKNSDGRYSIWYS